MRGGLSDAPGLGERIEFISRQDEELIAEKRRRMEEHLWAVHQANLKDYFETYEAAKVDKGGSLESDAAGKMKTVHKQRPRLLSDLSDSDEAAKLIDEVVLDRNGHYVPRLCSKRAMHNIGRIEDRPADVSRLSDAEPVAQLSEQAQQLGVKIDLSYSFDGEEPNAAIDATTTDDGTKPENA